MNALFLFLVPFACGGPDAPPAERPIGIELAQAVTDVDQVGRVDVTGDGRPDRVLATEDCGAHTCFTRVTVQTDDGGESRTVAPEEMRESYAEVRLVDRTGDGVADIVLRGGLVGSAGAGPYQRVRETTWIWSEGGFEQAGVVWDPSDLRLHRLQDGLLALADGELGRAAAAFAEVATDESLADTPEGADPDPVLRDNLAEAAALFLVRVAIDRGDRSAAVEWRGRIVEPALTAPADLLSAGEPCAAAAAELASRLDALGDRWHLDDAFLGYNTPVEIEGPELCWGSR